MINMIQSAKDQVLELTERAYRAAAAAGELLASGVSAVYTDLLTDAILHPGA